MKKFFCLFLFICANFLFSQKGKIINNESTAFQITNAGKPIDFIVFDTALDRKKPVFLWCQGSLPYPLYVHVKQGLWLIGGGITNFNVKKITENYHLVVISMPETPLIADEKLINEDSWYFGNSRDKNEPTLEFKKADYLENYTMRALKVLKFLRKQKWVDNSKLIVAGHSQGSKVAAKVAENCNRVTKVGLFGANPFGRIDQNIREARKDAEQKRITWLQADKEMEQQYRLYRDANNAEKVAKNPDLLPWKSFSEPLIDDWLRLKIPIYLAYGTADITSDLCDLAPLYFIRAHKNNLTYKRYFALEHNFFEVDEKGNPNFEKAHWPEVMDAFVDWAMK